MITQTEAFSRPRRTGLGAPAALAGGSDRKTFGRGQIIAAGRAADGWPFALGATATVLLDGDAERHGPPSIGQVAADVDVVIDYLWGEPARPTMIADLTNRDPTGTSR